MEPEEVRVQHPVLGVWGLEQHPDIILFLSSGEVKFEQGEILAAINRFQNTQRTRYTSRLQRTGRYEIIEPSELILYVTADWTGKGTGARRPTEKQVESRIVFDMQTLEGNVLTLRKKNMTQEGNETNLNEEEELVFTLIQKQ